MYLLKGQVRALRSCLVTLYNGGMKPETAKVWNVIKSNLTGFWHRVENTVWPGTPDTDYVIDGQAGKVELKYMKAWPKREDTKTDLGIEPAQRVFMREYTKNGGRGYILARVGNDWLLIHGGRDLTPATKKQWVARAVYYDSISPNYDIMVECLMCNYVEGIA